MATPTAPEAMSAILKILEKNQVVLDPTAPLTDYGWEQLGGWFKVLGIDRNMETFTLDSDYLIFEGKKFVRCTKTDKGYSWSVESAPVDMLLIKKDFLRMENDHYVFKRNDDTIFVDVVNVNKVS